MNNREFYSKKILDIACAGGSVALKDGVPCRCAPYECSKCDCYDGENCEETYLQKWSELEYIEKPVNWNEVEIDTPVLVKNTEAAEWEKRRFACAINGVVYTWESNMTSKETKRVMWWNFAKLDKE